MGTVNKYLDSENCTYIENNRYASISSDIILKSELDTAVNTIERNIKRYRRHINRDRWRNSRFKKKH